jgi:hypothetical protein
VGWIEEVIEALGFRRAKDVYDQAHAHGHKAPDHPMVQLVQLIEFELAQDLTDGGSTND